MNVIRYTCTCGQRPLDCVEGPVAYYGPADIKRCPRCGAVLTARAIGFTSPPDPTGTQLIPHRPKTR